VLKVLISSATVMFNHDFGNEGQTVHDLTTGLGKHDCFFYVIAGNIRTKPLKNTELHNVRLLSDTIYERRPTLGYLVGAYYAMRGCSIARKLLKKESIDLIHHMFPSSAGVSYSLLASLSNMPRHCPFIFGPITPTPALRGLPRIIGSKLHRATVSKAAALIVTSPALKAEYSQFFDPVKIWVIPHAIDIERFRGSQEEHEGFEVLAVANLLRWKGIDYLIKAIPLAIKEIENLKLRIVGDGPEKHQLIQLTKELNVDDRVIFEGRISNKAVVNAYQRADVFCLPSLSEAFGKVVVEAMACQKPVVVTNTEGPSQIVSHMEDGIIIPTADSEAIAEALITLANDSELRSRIGQKARARAVAEYSLAKWIERYYKVYQAVIGSKAK